MTEKGAPIDAPALLGAGDAEHRRAWSEIVARALRDDDTPGAAVALLVVGRLAFTAGVGFRDLARTQALPLDARFYIYSVTKLLLAVLTLQLVEQGRVALDAPIQTYLPDLPLEMSVTVRQALSHSGGLPDYGALPAYAEAVRASPGHPWTADEFFARTLRRGLLYPPGEGWAYSNIGFLIIRLLVERVAGMSLRALVERQIVAPLGLRQTAVAETLADAADLTPGFDAFFSADGALADIAPRYEPGWVAHGVVVSTASELARVVDATFSGQLLSPDSLAAMLDPLPVPVEHALFRQPSYGLGVMIDPASRASVTAGHSGGGPGYSAGALCATNAAGRRVVSVALANRDQSDLGLRIAHALLLAALEDAPACGARPTPPRS